MKWAWLFEAPRADHDQLGVEVLGRFEQHLGGVAGEGLHDDLASASLLGGRPAVVGQLLGLHPVGEDEADVLGHLSGLTSFPGPAPSRGERGDDDETSAVDAAARVAACTTARSAVAEPSVPTTMF